ncbi:ATP-binding protein [Streptomyces sp. TP-A0874]|uniref:ATP-binding protein n=1 Tax=Streptomyces sp. TP-A0874 TaxID=549819 RepID=UPI001FCD31BF|nr:ATP-binding protein [Streptomyces sp. TP-A0874]
MSHWLARAAREILPPDAGGVRTTGFAACSLSADKQAAGEARRFTRSTLSGWQMGPLVDNVALIVSELLSNALRYGLADTARNGDQAAVPPRPVRLGLLHRGQTVLCAVCDLSSNVPVLRSPDYLAQSGRGLHIIDSLSESWGWTTPNPAGKAVWAAVSSSK